MVYSDTRLNHLARHNPIADCFNRVFDFYYSITILVSVTKAYQAFRKARHKRWTDTYPSRPTPLVMPLVKHINATATGDVEAHLQENQYKISSESIYHTNICTYTDFPSKTNFKTPGLWLVHVLKSSIVFFPNKFTGTMLL